MLAGGDAYEDEEDEEESAPTVGSSKKMELGGSSKDTAIDMGDQGLVEPTEDITRD